MHRLLTIALLLILPTLVACEALGQGDDPLSTLDRLVVESSYYGLFAAASTAGNCSINDSQQSAAQFQSGTTINGTVVVAVRSLTTPGGLPIDYFLPQTGSSQPLVILLQGANVNRAYYSNYAARVASDGFVVAVPDICRSLFFNQLLFASVEAIADVRADVAARALLAGSFAARADGTRVGLLGHSLGSVVGIDALRGVCRFPFCSGSYSVPSVLKGGIFFGASSDATTIANGGLAVGLIQGNQDSLNEAAAATRTYQALSAPRVLVSIDGVDHYGLTDTAAPEDAIADPSVQTLPQTSGIALVGKYSGEFLKAVLRSDAVSQALIYSTANPETGVTIQAQP